MSHAPFRGLTITFLLAACLFVASCKSASPANRAARDAPLCCAAGVDLALTQDGMQKLIDRAIERPASTTLLSAGWDGLTANARSQGGQIGDVAKPAFSGDPKSDFASFQSSANRLFAGHHGTIDVTALNYAAVDRMAISLDDSHVTFLPPEAASRQNRRDAGNLGTSTGLRLERSNEHPPVILEVVPGSAAEQAGARPGDTVFAVNGRPVGSYSLRELGRALDGPDGSHLVLNVRHAGSARLQQITLTRRTIALDLVHSETLPGNVGYIRIREFPGQVPIQLQVQQAIGDFNAAQTKGIVVDLRGNPGGAISVMQAIVSLFVSQSPLGYVVGPDGREQSIPRTGPYDLHQKLVVLTDGGSASSAEVFAAAVQQYGDGLLVGEPTCGCLMAALFFPLTGDKSMLEIAVQRVLTPVQRQQVEKHPIMPDIPVNADPRLLGQGRDAQLEAAVQALGVDAATSRTATLAVERGQRQ